MMPRDDTGWRILDGIDYPLDLAYELQGFRGMRNGCSVSGGWFLKALEHEYIDSRMFAEVLCFVRFCKAIPPMERCVQFLRLHRFKDVSLLLEASLALSLGETSECL